MGEHPLSSLFFFNDTATTEIYTLSLHDALPIWIMGIFVHHWRRPTAIRRTDFLVGSHRALVIKIGKGATEPRTRKRSEEHTSELQSPDHLVCRLLLEKKKLHRTDALDVACHCSC